MLTLHHLTDFGQDRITKPEKSGQNMLWPVLLLLAGACMTVYAQDETQEKEIEEIYVYGQHIDRSLQDTQTSVSVVTGEELNRDSVTDLYEIADRTAGVSQQGGGFGFVIRGIPTGGVGGGTGATIDVTVDGASLPPGQSVYTGALSVWDLEQVELLRGPQSTQQGRNALAGAISMRSKDPGFERELKLRADYGSFNEIRVALAGNLPLTDELAMRVALENFSSEGDIENQFSGEDIGDRLLQTMRAKLRFMPNEKLDMIFGFTRTKNEFGSQSINPALWPGQRVNQLKSSQTGDSDLVTLRIGYEINPEWSIDSETTYILNDYDLFQEANPNDPFSGTGERLIKDEAVSQELRVNYATERLRAVLGFYYTEVTKDLFFQARIDEARVYLPFLPPGIGAAFGNTIDSTTENYAVYGELEFDLTPRWKVVAGARYDVEESDNLLATFINIIPPVFSFPQSPPEDRKADYDAFLPKAGLVFSWTDDLSTGFTVQRGYRAGDSAIRLATGEVYEYDPEFTTNYEFSFRSTWLDGRAVANANVFYTKWTDQQVSIPGPSGSFIDSSIQNAGESELYGGEFESRLSAGDSLELYFNIGYSKTKILDLISADAQGLPVNRAGNEFPSAPQLTGSAGASYRLGNGFEVHLDGSYTDDHYYTVNNDPRELSDSFFLLDARVGYRAQNWSVFAYSRNLLDEQYLSRRRVDLFDTAGDSRVFGVSLYYEM